MFVVNEETPARTESDAANPPETADEGEPQNQPMELKTDMDERTPEEAGYGYGV